MIGPDFQGNPFGGGRTNGTGTNGHANDFHTPLTIRSFHEIDFDPTTEVWLVEDLLFPEQISLVHGPTNCGKTFMALGLSLQVAAGGSWMGHKIASPGRVVFLASEGGKGIDKRIAAWKQANLYQRGDRLPFSVITEPVDLCHADSDDCQRIIATIKVHIGSEPLALLTIETVNSVMNGGNENGPEDMGRLLANAKRLRDELHCHIMLIHHPNKSGPGSRGHYSLPCAVDTELAVDKDEESGVATITMTKQREAERAPAFAFQLRQVLLGYNRDGKPVTSCVIDEADPPEEEEERPPSKPNRKERLTGDQQVALDALLRAIEQGQPRPAHLTRIPSSTVAIDVDLWFRHFKQIEQKNGQDLTDRQWMDRFYKLRNKLYEKGVAKSESGYAWLLQSARS